MSGKHKKSREINDPYALMAPFADSDFRRTLERAWQLQDYALAREVIEDALGQDETDSYLRVCYITALGHCSRFQSAQGEF